MTYYDPRTRNPALGRRPLNRRDDAWIRDLLARLHLCRISTLWQGEDGEAFPFINPTSFVYRPATHDLVYHSNRAGRLRANTEQVQRAAFEASEMGRFLPSNDPLELSVQYRSVVAFGAVRLLSGEDARQALYDLCAHVFPQLRPGVELQPISDGQLERTSVYALQIEQWSGKENWAEAAEQTPDWPPLPSGLTGG
ncbi:pyridoxamine 5'-phosphate oxidase family protein [Deinococcus irradiatisoli]|uniref:Pyridoxamine 5'-phosphate oxidase family protein n=1 Tax=Deinococcus irradiatisoli TaxID=2202254 RepID=A0A2Z3JHQ1_9DEIO|nr:pyridoxamine 5'-phosphate oxidase family protein [Deinococcus irradiatisoli]AWN24633.1 pyridoxamine 5'-phosphate oxidase family protein [Deinococcus irradiatisoli]